RGGELLRRRGGARLRRRRAAVRGAVFARGADGARQEGRLVSRRDGPAEARHLDGAGARAARVGVGADLYGYADGVPAEGRVVLSRVQAGRLSGGYGHLAAAPPV